MKKTILLLLAAAFIFAAACSASPSEGAVATVTKETVLDAGPSEGPTDNEAGALADESIGPVEITTPDPVFTDGAKVVDLPEVSVATPVPVFTATPGPTESFEISGSTIDVKYYDMESQQPASTQYPVTDPSDPQAVIDAVSSALSEVNNGAIKLNSAQYSNGNLFLDFDPGIYRSIATDSGTERQMLESIADTYLTNVDGIQAVFYTVDGQPYSSEHTQLNQDEAYKILMDETQPSAG